MKNTKESLGFLIVDVARMMRRRFEASVTATKLTQAQARALIYVSRYEGVRQIDLADMLEVKPITLARLLDQLQEAGFVERRADTKDRRAYRIYLTEAATPQLDDIHAVTKNIRSEALKNLSKQEGEILASALSKIRANLCTHNATNNLEKSAK